jgi:hypothetical protein
MPDLFENCLKNNDIFDAVAILQNVDLVQNDVRVLKCVKVYYIFYLMVLRIRFYFISFSLHSGSCLMVGQLWDRDKLIPITDSLGMKE